MSSLSASSIPVPVHQTYLEPHAATADWGADGILTVYASTQGTFAARNQISELLHYPLSKIKVIPTEVGGGFGGKNPIYVETPAALLSRKTGRPVRITMSRKETILGTGPGPRHVDQGEDAGPPETVKSPAVQADLAYEAGAYPGSAVSPGAMAMFAGYDVPNGQIDGYDVVVNKPRSAAYRAPGAPQSTFASEQVIDELARAIDIDPAEFRLKNVAREGTKRLDGPEHKSIGIEEMLGILEDHPHYNDPLDGPNQGRGIAIGYWGNWGARSSAAINVNSDGTVSLITGSVDLTGVRTSLAMQAADILEIPLESFQSTMVDTDALSYTDTAGGSRTTMATGIAAIEAAQDVLAKMKGRSCTAMGSFRGLHRLRKRRIQQQRKIGRNAHLCRSRRRSLRPANRPGQRQCQKLGRRVRRTHRRCRSRSRYRSDQNSTLHRHSECRESYSSGSR